MKPDDISLIVSAVQSELQRALLPIEQRLTALEAAQAPAPGAASAAARGESGSLARRVDALERAAAAPPAAAPAVVEGLPARVTALESSVAQLSELAARLLGVVEQQPEKTAAALAAPVARAIGARVAPLAARLRAVEGGR